MTAPTDSSKPTRSAALPYGMQDARPLELVRDPDPIADERRKDANTMIAAGLGVGAFGAASLALVGAACPLCVVAAPALVGLGVIQRIRSRRRR